VVFLRPEVRLALWRWREVLAGLVCLIFAAWLFAAPGWVLSVPGWGLICLGAALVWIGVQRGRFRQDGAGPGAVQVDEGEVSYFGPLTGGSVAMRDIEGVVLDGTLFPAHWRLRARGQVDLLVPVNAAGAEALFDAFSVLPGLETERMLQHLAAPPSQAIVIWERPRPRVVH